MPAPKLNPIAPQLRDGRHVLTAPIGEIDRPQLVKAIIGRPPTEVFVRETGSRAGKVA